MQNHACDPQLYHLADRAGFGLWDCDMSGLSRVQSRANIRAKRHMGSGLNTVIVEDVAIVSQISSSVGWMVQGTLFSNASSLMLIVLEINCKDFIFQWFKQPLEELFMALSSQDISLKRQRRNLSAMLW